MLAALTLVTFLLLLDDTAVAVALPVMQPELGLDLGGQEWAINAYTLALAALTLPAGRLADRDGQRRIFLLGLAVFTATSLALGFVGSGALLVAGRAVQGAGAALVGPTALALIASSFSARQRGVAIGVWAGVSASALGLGPVFGAVVADYLGWRWIFWLNAPLGLAAWLLVYLVVKGHRTPGRVRSLDLPAAGLSAVALSALLMALTRGNGAGWLSGQVLALFATAVAALTAFVWHESRTDDPLVDLSAFRRGPFAGSCLQIMLATSVMCSLFFFLALYLQNVRGYSALAAGVGLLPLTGAIVVVGPPAGRLVERTGVRLPVTAGMLVLGAALIPLSRQGATSSAATLSPWLALAGVGIGLVTAPATTAALGAGESTGYAAAAAVFNTFRTTGLALGIALMGAIVAANGPAALFSSTFDAAHHAAFVEGFSTALSVNAVIALAGAGLAAYLLRPRDATLAPPGSPTAEPSRAGR